jgi:hypothetical protein
MKEQLELLPGTPNDDAQNVITSTEKKIEDVEWCFQFFNNEPIVFAWSEVNTEPTPLIFQIEPVEGKGLTFQQNGMEFKIFPRPITKETQLEREK